MYNIYEAKSIIGDISLHLDEAYADGAKTLMIVMSIFAFAFLLFAAIAIKKARPLGIIAAIFQPIGFFSAMKVVLGYAQIDFSCLEMTFTSSYSMDDAMSKLQQALIEKFTDVIFPQMIAILPWAFLMFVTFIITLIYSIMLIKAKGKGLAVTALILIILRYLFVSPIELIGLLLQSGSAKTQSAWDVVFYLACTLPLFLMAIQGIINLASKKEPVVEAAVEAPVAETPVVEAPVEAPAEAPVEAPAEAPAENTEE